MSMCFWVLATALYACTSTHRKYFYVSAQTPITNDNADDDENQKKSMCNVYYVFPRNDNDLQFYMEDGHAVLYANPFTSHTTLCVSMIEKYPMHLSCQNIQ